MSHRQILLNSIALFRSLTSLVGVALIAVLAGASAFADEFLDPAVAFKVEAHRSELGKIEVNFQIAEAYYLYRERIKIEAIGAQLGSWTLPAGQVKYDDNFEKNVETYHHQLQVKIPVQGNAALQLKITLQGCAEAGLCYPPMTLTRTVAAFAAGDLTSTPSSSAQNLSKKAAPSAINQVDQAKQSPQASLQATPQPIAVTASLPAQEGSAATSAEQLGSLDTILAPKSEDAQVAQALKSGKLFLLVSVFLISGILLALTPCVLPMFPILSFIIVGEGPGVTRARSFVLSLAYVMGMASVYTLLGMLAGILGQGLAAELQRPSILIAFALLMAAFALAMFDVFQFQMPIAIQTRLSGFSQKQRKGKLFGVFLMGAISSLVVGPCVAAPMAGALAYIFQSHDLLIGGLALFSLAIGMGLPLILFGVSAGSLLPKAGAWMEEVKRFLGVLMLGLGLWMITPLLTLSTQMLAWGGFLMIAGIAYIFRRQAQLLGKVLGLVFVLIGLVQLIGFGTGGRDIFAPLAHLQSHTENKIQFIRIKSVEALDQVLKKNVGRRVMLDFYADWCVSCKEMEKLTFTIPSIRAQLDQLILLQIDVTANNEDDKKMLKQFGLFGPPGILFFDEQGRELSDRRVIGFQNADRFSRSLARLSTP